ncbi:MFS transporter [Kiloniella sp. EL199]|uniref:MFS transporter n=1 Tax=Kiloniella sp. EL199 TaxID=2107581 RepID=UPI000EA0E8E3|nr:MFS transporter [Kiloniella sp. EL199]
MLSAITNSWSLLLGIAFLMLGNGLQSTVLSVRGSIEGFSTESIGAVMTCYFIGYLAGSFVTPKVLANVGHVRVFAALASLSSASALMHAVFIDPYTWGAMRLITGFCFAGLYIVAESWLNDSSTNETRGQLLAVYMVVVYGAMGLGQLLINISDPGSFLPFILMSVLVSLALIPTTLTVAQVPTFESPTPVSLKRLFNISPLGFVCAFAVGAVQAQIFGLGAIYAKELNMTTRDISFFVVAMSIGGVALQWPIGKVSDHFDRRKVLIVVALLAGLIGISMGFFSGPEATVWFLGSAFLFGALCLPLYSLAIAHTNDYLDASEIVGATSALIVIGGIGAIVGPIISTFLMGQLGPNAFVYSMSVTLLLITAFGVFRMTQRSSVPIAEQGDYIAVPAESSTMVVAMTPEGEEWYEEVIAEAEAEEETADTTIGDEETESDTLEDGPAFWEEEAPSEEEMSETENTAKNG